MTPLVAAYQGKEPRIDESVFLAHGACIIGDVSIGRESSVWFNTVVRGDVNWIRIGERTNVQDGSVLHVAHERWSLTIGSDVTIGHRAIVHGCVIEDGCLIGMGATVLDGAVVHKNAMVAAGALVLEGFEVPEGMLAAGVPAKIKRALSEKERASLWQSAVNYAAYAKSYHSINY